VDVLVFEGRRRREGEGIRGPLVVEFMGEEG